MFGVGVATYVGGSGYICGWEWLHNNSIVDYSQCNYLLIIIILCTEQVQLTPFTPFLTVK